MAVDKQRAALIGQLETTREKLRPYLNDDTIETMMRDLPEPLQQEIRSYSVIGPVTSSGLEHVYQIFNRIDFAIFDLKNPPPPTQTSSNSTASAPTQQPTPTSTNDTKTIKINRPAPTPSTNQEKSDTIKRFPDNQNVAEDSELNFGPYDPRKGAS